MINTNASKSIQNPVSCQVAKAVANCPQCQHANQLKASDWEIGTDKPSFYTNMAYTNECTQCGSSFDFQLPELHDNNAIDRQALVALSNVAARANVSIVPGTAGTVRVGNDVCHSSEHARGLILNSVPSGKQTSPGLLNALKLLVVEFKEECKECNHLGNTQQGNGLAFAYGKLAALLDEYDQCPKTLRGQILEQPSLSDPQ